MDKLDDRHQCGLVKVRGQVVVKTLDYTGYVCEGCDLKDECRHDGYVELDCTTMGGDDITYMKLKRRGDEEQRVP